MKNRKTVRKAVKAHVPEEEPQPKLRLIMATDDTFEIFLDEKDQPWIRVGPNTPELSTFAEALRRHADVWPYQRTGSYGQEADYMRFFKLLADKLPEGV